MTVVNIKGATILSCAREFIPGVYWDSCCWLFFMELDLHYIYLCCLGDICWCLVLNVACDSRLSNHDSYVVSIIGVIHLLYPSKTTAYPSAECIKCSINVQRRIFTCVYDFKWMTIYIRILYLKYYN